MGTSLSGLTPATTFDGLLKTSDNEPLDATLKAISTGDGTDTILNLSTTAFKIGGDVEIDSSGLNSLIVKRNGSELLKTDGSGLNGGIIFTGNLGNLFSVGVKGNDFNIWDGSYLGGGDLRYSILADGKTGIGSQTPTAKLHIKGSGATAATIALLVQNNLGTDILTIGDDGFFKVRGGAGVSNLIRTNTTNNNVGIGLAIPDSASRMHIQGKGNDNTTTSLLVQNSDGTDLLKVNDDGATTIQSNFGVSGGDVAVFQNSVDPTNQFKINKRDNSTNIWYTGTTNSEIEYRDNIHFRFNFAGTTRMQLRNTGNLGLGVGSANASARMHIKGSGATSATTALLVENSAGTDLLKVRDDGWVDLAGTLNGGSIRANTLQIDSVNFKADGTNDYFQSQFTKNVFGSDNTNSEASALITMVSTTQGFLPPRMTTTERDAITTPAAGLMVYNTTTNKAQCYNGTTWNDLF